MGGMIPRCRWERKSALRLEARPCGLPWLKRAIVMFVMKIALLLSGGVDSSTALRRLLAAGHSTITAFYLKIWLEDEMAYMGECPWEEDLGHARAVCEQAGVPLEIVNLQLEYYDRVVEYAVAELRAGRTPSPDIFCNQRVKFGAFMEKVGADFDLVATGHYALVSRGDGTSTGPWDQPWREQQHQAWPDAHVPRLYRAPDPVKDQSYFLSHLSAEQLSRLCFPIGDLPKARVRELAASYDLPNKDRKDSQGICFLGKIPFNDFVRHYLGEQDGPLVDAVSGEELGRHKGCWFHTVGQRSGLGLGNGPWYVAAKDVARNVVYVSHATLNPQRERRSFEIDQINWIGGQHPLTADLERWNSLEPFGDEVASSQGQGLAEAALEDALASGSQPAIAQRAAKQAGRDYRGFQLKLRHGPVLVPCRARWIAGYGPDSTLPAEVWRLELAMERPDPGIAAGQFAVLYVDDECLGSGRIREVDSATLDGFWQVYQSRSQADAAAREAERARKQAKAAERKARYRSQGKDLA